MSVAVSLNTPDRLKRAVPAAPAFVNVANAAKQGVSEVDSRRANAASAALVEACH